jgi:predicted transcriptional regulator
MEKHFLGKMPTQRPRTKFKNRNRLGILANLLTVARNGSLKTHLMYNANLSYTMLKDYLQFLRDNGLVTEETYDDENVTIYKTTDRGLKFLGTYEALRYLAAPDEKQPIATQMFG